MITPGVLPTVLWGGADAAIPSALRNPHKGKGDTVPFRRRNAVSPPRSHLPFS